MAKKMNSGQKKDSDQNLSFEKLLRSALFRSTCPPVDDLMNQQFGLLSEEQSEAIQKHIDLCPHCQAEAEELAPPHSSTESKNTPEHKSGLIDSTRIYFARLLSSTAAVRGEDPGTRGISTVSLVYETEKGDLTLSWSTGPGAGFSIQGQFLGLADEPVSGITADLIEPEAPDQPIAQTSLDPDGIFSLSALPAGHYTLRLRLPDGWIPITDVSLE